LPVTPPNVAAFLGLAARRLRRRHRPRIDHAALDVYRLAWDLNEVAESLNVLRSPHGESEDTTWAYDALTTCMPTRDQWSRLLVR
jgi:hypothetical protein